MYSFTLFWIGPKDASIAIQVSVVVSTTSASDSPSTPTVYVIPNIGIHEIDWVNWYPPTVLSYAASRTSDATHVRSPIPSAVHRMSCGRLEGRTASRTEP